VEKHSGNGTHITPPTRIPKVDEHECVGCNLCWLVCPVENCITMDRVDVNVAPQSWEQRTGASKC
jgi:dihydropyrimidine dehydrogenase (NAD+) subunit PreA